MRYGDSKQADWHMGYAAMRHEGNNCEEEEYGALYFSDCVLLPPRSGIGRLYK